MNNFIEINTENSQVIINLNFVTSITQGYDSYYGDNYYICLVNSDNYRISKEQYEEIKAKLIDKNSKE